MKPAPKNTRAPKQRQPKVVLTPEQIAERELARKEENLRLEQYEASVGKMSHRQLRGELRRTIRGESTKEGNKRVPVPGLTITFATILAAVLDNSKTLETKLRADQKNPSGRLHAYPL